jgi:hypothetical protein
MGMAKLNVWVRDKDFPCRPDMRWIWSVDVFVCDGRPLEWCGTTYYGAHRTRHGHVEIELPPGCYIVRARTGSKGHHNLFTHMTMVVVGCGETACVNLVPPGAWTCGVQFNMALEFQARIGNVPRDLAERAIEANRAIVEYLPKDRFPIEEAEPVEAILRMAEEEEKREQKS